ncbi:hypothetical protein ACFVX6_19180 [Streptomyces sp. NPDC058289]|uniref:hypothetical protein n=1 Tax=Streptomyces sp. NPDC058289 TaxID=3346425 RepID=UPI0036EEDDD7
MNFDENEPQSVREQRFVAERVERRAARKAATLDSRAAHLGALIVTVALALPSWYGKLAALSIVSGVVGSGPQYADELTTVATLFLTLEWTITGGTPGRVRRPVGIPLPPMLTELCSS